MHAELIYKIMNAPIYPWPYPHLEIDDFLPWDLYAACVENWPDDFQDISKVRPVGGYKDRKAIHFKTTPQDGPWKELYDIAMDPGVVGAWQAKMGINSLVNVVPDSLLVEDHEGYSIGPHTDSPAKLVSILLYFPGRLGSYVDDPIFFENAEDEHLGTSIYWPPDGFTCPGGPHYDRASHDFQEVRRFEYRPNKLVAFKKTNNSFHGVEPVPKAMERRVFIWNLRTSEING